MGREKEFDWGVGPAIVITPWAHEAADITYGSLVSDAQDLQNMIDDTARIARAIQRAYNRGVVDGKKSNSGTPGGGRQ